MQAEELAGVPRKQTRYPRLFLVNASISCKRVDFFDIKKGRPKTSPFVDLISHMLTISTLPELKVDILEGYIGISCYTNTNIVLVCPYLCKVALVIAVNRKICYRIHIAVLNCNSVALS